MKFKELSSTELQTLLAALDKYIRRDAVRTEITMQHESALALKLSEEIFSRRQALESERRYCHSRYLNAN